MAVCLILDLSLLLLAHRHKVLGHVAHVHHARSVPGRVGKVKRKNIGFLNSITHSNLLEHIVLHLRAEAKNVKGFVGKLHVLLVVDGGHSELSLGHVPVVLDV